MCMYILILLLSLGYGMYWPLFTLLMLIVVRVRSDSRGSNLTELNNFLLLINELSLTLCSV